MNCCDLGRYGLRYALTYVAILASLTIVSILIETFTGIIVGNLSIGAMIGAPLLTHERFLKTNDRLLDQREYWSLVWWCTAIAVVLDLVPGFLLIYLLHDGTGVDGQFILLVLGAVLAKGLLGNMIFYSRFLGSRLLDRLRRKRVRGV